jgi:hypothetical protein
LRRRISSFFIIGVVVLALAGCSGPPPPQRVFVDPGLAPLIPPDATLLAGARVDLLAKHPAFPLLAKQRAVQRFVEVTGVNPAKDLWQVLIASNGRDVLLLGRGKFANELMAPDVKRYGNTGGRFDYKGLSMVGSEQDAMVFINSSTAAIGPAPVLRALLDARAEMHDVPARFAPLLTQIPLESQVWGAYVGGPVELEFPGNFANLRRVFGMLQTATFYANADTGLHLTAAGTSPSEAQAQELHDTLQGLMALAQLKGDVTRDASNVKLKIDAVF